jgi:hypothetical protein
MTLKTLRLPIKKVWFDMIKAGIKLEEYREIKMYWWTRLVECGECYDYSKGVIGAPLLPANKWKMLMAKKYDYVEFINGYGKSAPRLLVECLGIEIGFGKTEWGEVEGEKYFVIKLGEIISASAQ